MEIWSHSSQIPDWIWMRGLLPLERRACAQPHNRIHSHDKRPRSSDREKEIKSNKKKGLNRFQLFRWLQITFTSRLRKPICKVLRATQVKITQFYQFIIRLIFMDFPWCAFLLVLLLFVLFLVVWCVYMYVCFVLADITLIVGFLFGWHFIQMNVCVCVCFTIY